MPRTLAWISILCVISACSAAASTRVKELATLEGIRDNQLVGYGLVVGLAGTGDRQQTVFSVQSLTNMLKQMGVVVSPLSIRVANTAAVMVTASLPPFAQPGATIDVTVGAIGDCSNLQGGLLVLTSLRAVDGQIYAVAQGSVVTGGFIAGRGANSQTTNHPTVGRIANGAIVERPSPAVGPHDHVKLQLREADFATAAKLSAVVNAKFAPNQQPIAKAENSGVVAVKIPESYSGRQTEFIADMEELRVDADRRARVVINERTGTIIMGKEVRVAPVAIMHGNLTVEIQTTYNVSQPQPLSTGTTQVVPQVGVGVKEEKARNVVLKEGATIEELVRALTSIGSTPRDIIAILQSLRSAGALEAELEVI
jgi:flagellar P-ring protein precursor FlgI